MIRNFTKEDIFVMFFTSSRTNYHDEQICTLIGPISTSTANGGSRWSIEKMYQYMALRHMTTMFFIYHKIFFIYFDTISFVLTLKMPQTLPGTLQKMFAGRYIKKYRRPYED